MKRPTPLLLICVLLTVVFLLLAITTKDPINRNLSAALGFIAGVYAYHSLINKNSNRYE